MKRLVSTHLAAAIAALGILGASAAQARSDVGFSVTIQSPGGYVQPAPVYVQPAPVYRQPVPVYNQPVPVYNQPVVVYGQPNSIYVQPAPVYVQPAYGYRYGHHYDHRHHPGWRGDWDRDGVPNRYDRFPNNPYYR